MDSISPATVTMVRNAIGPNDPLDPTPNVPDALGMLVARVMHELGVQARWSLLCVSRVDWEARAMFDPTSRADGSIEWGTRTKGSDAVGRGNTPTEALHELLDEVREIRSGRDRAGRLVA